MSSQNAKYSFYYLLSLVALIFTSISSALILFGIIDLNIADSSPYSAYRNIDSQIKFALASLLVSVPTYYISVYLINRGLKKGELPVNSSLRRWLTYLIIFSNSLIILGIIISILYNFLSGDLSARFLLKLISVLLIAALIFSYYFYDIKRIDFNKMKGVRFFILVSALIIISIFISAWFFIDSPATTRAKRADQNLMTNIYQLENAVNQYYAIYNRLPDNLEEIQSSDEIYLQASYLLDPETKKTIDYFTENESFFLCAQFRLNSDDLLSYSYIYNQDRSYEAGYSCIDGQLWAKNESFKNLKY